MIWYLAFIAGNYNMASSFETAQTVWAILSHNGLLNIVELVTQEVSASAALKTNGM